VAGALLVLWAVIQLLISIPALHHALHEDSTSPNHHCLVTELASGQGITASSGLSLPTLPECLLFPSAVVVSSNVRFLFRLPQAPRPPPVNPAPFSLAGSARV
jgi:hypothetical protein